MGTLRRGDRAGRRAAIAALVGAAALSAAAPAEASGAEELLREARAHEAAHEDDVALRRYTDALALDPTCAPCYLGLASLRARLGDAREAERVYSTALEHVPGLREALLGRARSRRAIGWRREAEEDLEAYAASASAREGGGDPAALGELAAWYGEDGRVPAQLATWRRVRVLAERRGDAPLVARARTMVKALQILVGPADPAVAPVDPDRTRRAIAAVARRAG